MRSDGRAIKSRIRTEVFMEYCSGLKVLNNCIVESRKTDLDIEKEIGDTNPH